MKAISLLQPWATLVAIGAKRIETRSFQTHYRGELAIHASRGFARPERLICSEPDFRKVLGSRTLPLGKVLATCNLVACVRTESLQDPEAITEQERLFGNYTRGRWAWVLEDIQPLAVPVPAKGKLGFWEWEGL